MTVVGNIAEPACTALQPATCCRNSVRKKPRIDSPAYIVSVSALPIAKLRRRNSESGSIGDGVRASCARNRASSASPAASGTSTPAAHPSSGWRTSAYTGPARPRAQRTPPSQSTGGRWAPSLRPGTATHTTPSVTRTNGTLMAKTHRHDAVSMTEPPATGPRSAAMPTHAVHEPIAAPRSAGGYAATITARALGVSIAPNRPCSARPATSTPIVGATAHTSDIAPKPATPSEKTRRSPKTSPSRPPTRISEPSTSRYALTTHCWPARPPPRSRSIAGSATFTTVASRNATNEPMIAASRLRRLRVSVERSVRRTLLHASGGPKRGAHTAVPPVRRREPPGSPPGGARHRVPHAAPAGDRAPRAARRPLRRALSGVPRRRRPRHRADPGHPAAAPRARRRVPRLPAAAALRRRVHRLAARSQGAGRAHRAARDRARRAHRGRRRGSRAGGARRAVVADGVRPRGRARADGPGRRGERLPPDACARARGGRRRGRVARQRRRRPDPVSRGRGRRDGRRVLARLRPPRSRARSPRGGWGWA